MMMFNVFKHTLLTTFTPMLKLHIFTSVFNLRKLFRAEEKDRLNALKVSVPQNLFWKLVGKKFICLDISIIFHSTTIIIKYSVFHIYIYDNTGDEFFNL